MVLISLVMATWLFVGSPSNYVSSLSTHSSAQPFVIDYGWIPQQRKYLDAYAKSLQGYRVVVLGSGDENPKNGEVSSIRYLEKTLPRLKWYGYISIGVTHGEPGYSHSAIEKRIKEWKALRVQGILIDCAGPSYGTSEARRVWVLNAVHRAGLHVLMNAFTPSALFALHPHKGDAWLAENWVINNGKPTGQQGQEWWAILKMKQRGWQIWATATGASFPTNQMAIKEWVTKTIAEIQPAMVAVSGPNYASVSNRLVPSVVLDL